MGYNRKRHEKGGGRGGGNGNRRQRGRGHINVASATRVVVDAASEVRVRPLVINEETRWKPRSLTANKQVNESKQTQDARLVLLLLNKLTPQNFNKLVPCFVSQCTIHKSNERKNDTINAIIDRASLDMRYGPIYAHLCKRLASDLPNGEMTDGEAMPVSFRDSLLTFCRENINPPVDGSSAIDLFEHPEERRIRLAIARHHYVGSQRFVGELYNSGTFQSTETL
jgi:hypothetical protein